ncbi:hypothetical protein F441_01650 [Phytophthora nicotianae CJ01A1]|uniref:RxLR effector protein n=4 Tax=Phytophthora nicotianae TaxID=4792 RepID=W2QST9_PHYN3|nr:hypothetical protein PPTG_06810 [Phytophthora nicotianae INRA-310]ETK95472.1 hypothetical protein L915_01602 [Phytophthora nicotianae]ETP25463.1 hypothetical protein F441_01650 [Phytophthora nicotianae CJ01A1]ETP53474.1 hypothetical protein F442_01624 [Phytophthora nicotianae P10297]ETL48851.1 hypothetical protein L916_01581 [Phytophthora nicotianae]ETM01907.1 hypothetical protein L917_01551 [Phytophthora nicotianae]
MNKHSIVSLLFVLIAVMTFSHANDAIPTELEEVPAGVALVGDKEPIPGANTEQFIGGRGRLFRHRFRFPYGGGFRYGWRYPLGWWNSFGRPIYGPSCLFGRPIGGFFFC